MDVTLRFVRKLIPERLFRALQPWYHWLLALSAAVLYRFPSRRLTVIGVTGTKGKSSVTEILAAILTAAGHKTASASTIRFSIAGTVRRNLFKMTMPGRFFLQQFLHEATAAGCTHAVLEVTSEGIRQHRHKFIAFDSVVFTNLAPEHIESHGSFEAYAAAKLSLAAALEHSRKRPRYIVANTDDAYGERFLASHVEVRRGFSLSNAEPYETSDRGIRFTFKGASIVSPLKGEFNIYNALAAATLADAMGVGVDAIKTGIECTAIIPGRAQEIDEGQDFTVVVDYAHTAESLEAVYRAYKGRKKICVLGSTGGGRDKGKRVRMGATAEAYCDEIILTDEDPYDEDPRIIIEGLISGMQRRPNVVMDRREAIREAFLRAGTGDVVLITGKGTDPFICGPNGSKIPWSDEDVAREELRELSRA